MIASPSRQWPGVVRDQDTADGRVVVLVCGPPGSGKTTWAKASGLTIYDRDDPQWQGESHFTASISALAYDPGAHAVVIRSGATLTARAKAHRLIGATEMRIIDTAAAVCKERVRDRRRPRPPMRVQLVAVDHWWATYEPPARS